jgi:sRNA-binding carbon storage regulator CsrA
VIRVQGDKVRLGFEAPREVVIHRQEIYERIRQALAENPPVNPDPPGDEPRSDPAKPARRTS